MNPNLNQAVIEFLANEYHFRPEDILPDTDFTTDFGLTQEQLVDLIGRMQDALDFILPEDKINDIKTVGDLLKSLEPETHEPESD
jgi:acyl carrier protein